jgi:phosphotriesterase-related protein
VVVGHCDDARFLDAARERELAAQGAYIAYDHVGWGDAAPHALPDEQRAQRVKALVAAGGAERLLLSCGTVGCGLGVPASQHGVSRLLKDFVPRLARAGISDSTLHTLLVENPRRLFARAPDRGTPS